MYKKDKDSNVFVKCLKYNFQNLRCFFLQKFRAIFVFFLYRKFSSASRRNGENVITVSLKLTKFLLSLRFLFQRWQKDIQIFPEEETASDAPVKGKIEQMKKNVSSYISCNTRQVFTKPLTDVHLVKVNSVIFSDRRF